MMPDELESKEPKETAEEKLKSIATAINKKVHAMCCFGSDNREQKNPKAEYATRVHQADVKKNSYDFMRTTGYGLREMPKGLSYSVLGLPDGRPRYDVIHELPPGFPQTVAEIVKKQERYLDFIVNYAEKRGYILTKGTMLSMNIYINQYLSTGIEPQTTPHRELFVRETLRSVRDLSLL